MQRTTSRQDLQREILTEPQGATNEVSSETSKPTPTESSLPESILVLSNRLPFTFVREAQGIEVHPSPGGLVSALDPVLRRQGSTWIGWPGISVEELGEEPLPSIQAPYTVVPVPLRAGEVENFYFGFSNSTLWPLFHSMPGRSRFDHQHWEAYERVNQRFAECAAKEAQSHALIWIHDYQLMLAPAMIRLQHPNLRIAFFFHIPFPPYDIFRLLPWDRELLNGLMGCDLIGFHVRGYAQNFLDCVERRLGARVDREKMVIHYGDRSHQVGVFPLGIDFQHFEQAAQHTENHAELATEKILLGVDRLDYTKGIPERIRAFELFLERYPEHREKVVLLQVAVPSREDVTAYQELKHEIEALVGQVNGRFATATWSPIRYLYRSLSFEQLTALYRDARVALVTPLRDGMNLVAKEFVACQVDNPGVLMLSRLAGAAETMPEALLINPYNLEQTAETIQRALTMDETERRSRMAALRRRERRDNVHVWLEQFLSAATRTVAATQTPTASEIESWLSSFLRGYQLALFLDYDGTLTPRVDDPSKAFLSAPMRQAIASCAARPDTHVAVVSGRKIDEVRKLVNCPSLIYAGNHGLEIAGPNIPPFLHEDASHYQTRALELAKHLLELEGDGVWVEQKGPTLTLHFRKLRDPQARLKIENEARSRIIDAGFQARSAHDSIEAWPPIGWDKGRAVLHILRSRYGPAWSESVRVIYIGDDRTDEDAFRFLQGLAMTFRVGRADTLTAARHRLADINTVKALLRWIAKRPQ